MIKAVVIEKENGREKEVKSKIFQTLDQFYNYRTVIEQDDWSLTVRMQII